METKDKVLENRCRRAATRRGYIIRKDRQRDPKGLRYGRYYVELAPGLTPYFPTPRIFTDLHELAEWLDLT